MKEVYCTHLPRNKQGNVLWGDCTGFNVEFVFDKIKGSIHIVSYNKTTRRLLVEYQGVETSIYTSNFLKANLGEIVGVTTVRFKFSVGDVINNLKLLSCCKKYQNGRNIKWYSYVCEKCGFIGEKREGDLLQGYGCTSCSGTKSTHVGVNDLLTIHPHIANMLDDKDRIKYKSGSHAVVNFTCPECGHMARHSIKSVVTQGYSCPRCSDGISYPNRFVLNCLKQVGINYEREFSPKWFGEKRYRYDFLLEDNLILEVDGGFHFVDNFYYGEGGRKVREVDKIKEDKAHENGYKVIRIKADKSESQYIKEHILSSELADLYDLSTVDWMLADAVSQKSTVKAVCNRYTEVEDKETLAKEFDISTSQVYRYLRKGYDFGWIPEFRKRRQKRGEV